MICNKTKTKRFSQVACAVVAVAIGIGAVGLTRFAMANTLPLADLNSQFNVNTTADGGSSWLIEGTNTLLDQTFLYRLGSTGTMQQWQFSSSSAFDIKGDGQNQIAVLTYTGADGLALQTIYTLTGGTPGSGTSLVSEQFQVTNQGISTADLHLLQYNSFQLPPGGTNALQFNTPPSDFLQISSLGSAEGITTGNPQSHGADDATTLLNSIQNDSPVVLNNNSNAVFGNPAAAWQWDQSLPVGGTFSIGQQFQINLAPGAFTPPVPEPSTMALLAMFAAVGAALMRRGRAKSQPS